MRAVRSGGAIPCARIQGLWGVLRGRWHEARRWASWESDGGDSARKGWFDGTLRVT
jgi:hypothetical protein